MTSVKFSKKKYYISLLQTVYLAYLLFMKFLFRNLFIYLKKFISENISS